MRAAFVEKWKISLILIACGLIIASVLILYFHSGESFSIDFSGSKTEDLISLNKGDELKFYFKVPEDGFSGLDIRIKPAPKAPIFSIQLVLRQLYNQKIVTQQIIPAHNASKDGFLKLRFDPLIFSHGSEFELALSYPKSTSDTNLEFIVLGPDNRIQSLPTIYTTSVLKKSLAVKMHFTKPLFIWRILLNHAIILLILATFASFLVFKALPEKYRYPWAIFYFSVILMLPTYVIISPDEEGFYNSLIGAILKSRALADGNLPFWDSFHGIGMPYNAMSSVNWHPVWLLLDKVPLSVVVSIMYHIHVLIALFAMFGLARFIGSRESVAYLCAVSYICSTPAITYIYGENFWPSATIRFTLIPLIFFFLIKFLHEQQSKKRTLYSLLTASSVGFLMLNCHLNTAIYMPVGFSFFLLMNWRRLIARWPWVLLLGFVILLITAPRLVDLFEELKRYQTTGNYVSHYIKHDFLGLFIWPAIKVNRGLAFGGPFFVLSLIGIFWPGLKSVHRAAFGISIIGCYALWLMPSNAFFPANWATGQFIVMFSVLLAGLVAEQLWRSRQQQKKRLMFAILLSQLLIVLSGAADFWHANAKKSIDYVRNKNVKVLKTAFKSSPLTRVLEIFNKGQGGRSYFTHEAEKTLMRELIFGYHFESLPLNGFRILNGRFNGIDYRDIHPNRAFMKAHLVGSKKILFNKSLLDVLGIKYIFADFNESVPSGLVQSALLPGRNDQIIVMYTNPTAWPDAVAVDEKIRLFKPKTVKGNSNSSLLFNDFEPLLALRNPEDVVNIKRDHGSITLNLDSSNDKRTILLNEYFRTGWKAESVSFKESLDLKVFPVFGHLIGVEVPVGATVVRLSYATPIKTIFLFFSLGILILSVLIAFILFLGIDKKYYRVITTDR